MKLFIDLFVIHFLCISCYGCQTLKPEPKLSVLINFFSLSGKVVNDNVTHMVEADANELDFPLRNLLTFQDYKQPHLSEMFFFQ